LSASEPKSLQKVSLDSSAIDAFIAYIKNRTNENLEILVAKPGSKLAYRHHLWSSLSSELTIEEFWKKELAGIDWNEQLGASEKEIIEYLVGCKTRWLETVLIYLPEGHVFNTTVYFIIGYDSIVYCENLALNLNSASFHKDRREAAYYLIHELAHAGYFKYRQMPDLPKLRTGRELLDAVKLLTHLEGMGVVSSFKLRVSEGGLLDNDYQVLLRENERNARVHDYFMMLSKLEKDQDRNLTEADHEMLSSFSQKPRRLWYIAGGHMALKIEERFGRATLQNLVKEGHNSFFNTYLQVEDPLSI
jgi:Putative zinc dependent peptidase (DUF5700)